MSLAAVHSRYTSATLYCAAASAAVCYVLLRQVFEAEEPVLALIALA